MRFNMWGTYSYRNIEGDNRRRFKHVNDTNVKPDGEVVLFSSHW